MVRFLNSSLGRFLPRFALISSGIFMLLICINHLVPLRWTWRPLGNQLACTDEKASSIHWSRGRLDNRRMVRIYEWIWIGEQWGDLTKRFDVCLATQSSLDRVFSIAEVSEKWLGPVSLAVYIRVPDEWIVLNFFVKYMQRCSVSFAQTVSVHVAVPVNYEPSNNHDTRIGTLSLWSTYPCGQPSEFLAIVMEEIMTSQIDSNSSVPYPQNHMRNIARKTCGTPWVSMLDVDIIPRPNSAQMLQEFYNSPASNCSRCQFVMPVYEMLRGGKYPESKKELIEYEIKGIARQFWLIPHNNSHFSSNQSLWAHTNIEEGPIKISHNVDSVRGNYEPFYIGSDDISAHDERFLGFGYTRPSQVLEALETGWTFKVLTPIFLIHRGFKETNKESEPDQISNVKNMSANATKIWTDLAQASGSKWTPSRAAQHNKNEILFNDFKAELKARKSISLARNNKDEGA